MTRVGKQKFIRDLCDSTMRTILMRVPDMPAEWDGIELRQYIADQFAAQCFSRSMRAGLTSADRKRRWEYKNTVAIRNL